MSRARRRRRARTSRPVAVRPRRNRRRPWVRCARPLAVRTCPRVRRCDSLGPGWHTVGLARRAQVRIRLLARVAAQALARSPVGLRRNNSPMARATQSRQRPRRRNTIHFRRRGGRNPPQANRTRLPSRRPWVARLLASVPSLVRAPTRPCRPVGQPTIRFSLSRCSTQSAGRRWIQASRGRILFRALVALRPNSLRPYRHRHRRAANLRLRRFRTAGLRSQGSGRRLPVLACPFHSGWGLRTLRALSGPSLRAAFLLGACLRVRSAARRAGLGTILAISVRRARYRGQVWSQRCHDQWLRRRRGRLWIPPMVDRCK